MPKFTEDVQILKKDGKAAISLTTGSTAVFTQGKTITLIDGDSILVGATLQLPIPDIFNSVDLSKKITEAAAGPKAEKPHALLAIGGKESPGVLRLNDSNGVTATAVDCQTGTIQSRMKLQMLDEKGAEALLFDPKSANVRIGGVGGNGGDLQILNGNRVVIHLDGDLRILDDAGAVVIHLDRKARDIKLKGADCAETFATDDASALEPGSLCVIGPSGGLEPCSKPYDTRVAGVVAGAGNLHPGIVLGQGTIPEQSVALSITGRVWCKMDASFSPIVPGDLVTTSTTPGYGMRANDRSRLTGAIAGKALAGLASGRDLVPILVGLQ